MNPSVAPKTDRAERKQCTPEIWQTVVVERSRIRGDRGLAASYFEIGRGEFGAPRKLKSWYSRHGRGREPI